MNIFFRMYSSLNLCLENFFSTNKVPVWTFYLMCIFKVNKLTCNISLLRLPISLFFYTATVPVIGRTREYLVVSVKR